MDSYRRIEAWQRAHELCVETLRAADRAYHPRARVVLEQLRRAVVSVERNIVEGYALGTRPLFRRHLRIAFGSAAESETLLRLARECRYLPDPQVERLLRTADRTLAILYRLLKSLE